MLLGEALAGKYRLDAVLGEGAMGVVWRATQLDLDREVGRAARGDVAMSPAPA